MSRARLRTFIILSVVVLIVVGVQDLLLQRLFQERARAQETISLQEQLGTIRSSIEATIISNLLRVEAMAAYVGATPNLSTRDFSRFAANVVAGSALRNIAVAPDFVIRDVYPLEGNEAIVGFDYRENEEQWPRARLARESEQMVVDGPIDLIQGGVGIIGRVPVFVETDSGTMFWGLTSSVIDFDRVFESALRIADSAGLEFALRRAERGREIVFLGSATLFADSTIEPLRVTIPNGEWELTGRFAQQSSIVPSVPVHVGSVGLAFAAVFFIWGRLRRDEQVARAKDAYRDRLEIFFSASLYGAFFTTLEEPVDVTQSIPDDLLERAIAGERITRSNAAMDRMYAAHHEEVAGWTPGELFSIPQEMLKRLWRELLETGKLTVELPHVCRDGNRLLFEGYYLGVYGDAGKLTGHFGVQREVTSERVAAANLQRYVGIVDVNVITSQTDLEGRITAVSSAFCEISGYTRDELIGARHSIVSNPDADRSVFSGMWEVIAGGRTWHGEFRNRCKNGDSYWVAADISQLTDLDGKVTGFMSVQQDITAQKRVEELSVTDRLTGLANRHRIDDVLRDEHERFLRYETNYALVLLDVDRFKSINDTLGHLSGDQVLRRMASLLAERTRATDIPGRWGGEEFLVLCPMTDCDGGAVIAETIRSAIEEAEFEIDRQVTVSVGVASSCDLSGDDRTTDAMLALADAALYEAKASGRNRVVCAPVARAS